MPDVSHIRIGTAGWSYKDWDHVFYPPEVLRKVHKLAQLPAETQHSPFALSITRLTVRATARMRSGSIP